MSWVVSTVSDNKDVGNSFLTGIAQIGPVVLRLVADVFRGVVDTLVGFRQTRWGDTLVGLLVGHDDPGAMSSYSR